MTTECPTEGTTAPPDWSAVPEEVHCPLCNYNLRGLTVPRCPECGYRFAWPEVLDPRQRLHPYLFEHHPERNFRSFWRTAISAFRPRRFWTSLLPAQPSSPRRLVAYIFIGQSLYLCAVTGLLLAEVVEQQRMLNAQRAGVIASNSVLLRLPAANRAGLRISSRLQSQLNSIGPPITFLDCLAGRVGDGRFPEWVTRRLIIPLLWPWLTFASLQVFWISMRRAKVKPIHALRCTLYSLDGALWIAMLVLIGQGIALPMTGKLAPGEWLDDNLGAVWFAAVLIGIWRMGTAYAHYMRLDHPLATITASQIIVGLVVLQLMLVAILVQMS